LVAFLATILLANFAARKQGDQMSMLWSQFSAIFLSIFGEKIGVFLKNECHDQHFA
jgi:hypothetical protein